MFHKGIAHMAEAIHEHTLNEADITMPTPALTDWDPFDYNMLHTHILPEPRPYRPLKANR